MISITLIDKRGAIHQENADEHLTLMQVLREAGRVEAVCGGEMACGTCAVRISHAWGDRLGAQSDTERALLEGLGLDDPEVRLSCQIPLNAALDGLAVAVLKGS